MSLTPTILADDTGKIITGLIFALIWGLSAIASVVKKANEQAKRKAAMRPLTTNPQVQQSQPPRAVSQPAARKPPAFRNPNSVFVPSATQRQLAANRAVARPPLPAQVSQPAPSPLSQRTAPPVSRAGSTTETRPAQTPAASGPGRPGGANAATIRRWLQPATVRRQFILTELFQPALVLREPSNRLGI